MEFLDMIGEPCPIPVTKAKEALADPGVDGVDVMVDNIMAVRNLEKMADGEGHDFSYRPAGETHIGNDVWIGMDAMIMPGVTIGDGAIIAARSLVTQDVPPYCMVAGTPARVIRQRFAVQETTRLQALAWWDWPDEQVQALLPQIQQGEVALLEQAAARWHSAEQE